MALGGGSSGGGAGAIKAGAAFVELFVKNQLTKGLNSAAKDLKAFGAGFGNIGRKIALTGAAAGAALGTLFVKSVGRSAEFGALSLKFGDTAENLSALSYAAGQASLSQEELFLGFKKFPSAMIEAQDETSKLGELFKSLGLDAKAMAGQSLTDSVIQFADALNASGLGDVDRLSILQDVFGKSGQQFNEFLAGGSKEIRSMMEEARSVGAVISSEQAAQAKRVEDTFSKTFTAMKTGLFAVGDALLPNEAAITKISDAIVAGTASFRAWIAANREVVLGITLAIGGVVTLGVAMWALGPAIAAIGTAWTVFTGAVGTGIAALGVLKAIVLSPILAIPAALAAAGAAWLAFTDKGRAVVSGFATAIQDSFGPTWENLKNGWKGVVAAIGRGDFGMALEIGLAVGKVEWIRFTNFLETTWNKTVNSMREGFLQFIDTDFGKGLEKAGDGFIAWVEDIADFIGPNEEFQKELENGRFAKKKEGDLPAGLGQGQRGFGLRVGGMNPNDLALKQAQQELSQLLWRNANMNGPGLPGGPGATPDIKADKLAEQISSLNTSIRSSIGGSAGLGMFGGNSVGNRIADNTKETATNLDDLLSFVRTNGLVYQ